MILNNTFTFLKHCNEDANFQSITQSFTLEQKNALYLLMSQDSLPQFVWDEGKLTFFINAYASFLLTISFDDTFYTDAKYQEFPILKSDLQYDDTLEQYKLTLSLFNDLIDDVSYVNITFKTFDIVIQAIDVFSNLYISETPMDYLCDAALFIRAKYELFPSCCNEVEIEHLELIDELALLSDKDFYVNKANLYKLKQLVATYNNQDILTIINKLETYNCDSLSFINKKLDLFLLMNHYKQYSIWLHLYQILLNTQTSHKKRIDDTQMHNIRRYIANELNKLGYEGEYPTFTKQTNIKHLYLTMSYNLPYIGGFDKNALCYIYCNEYLDSYGNIQIQFVAGTNLKPENQDFYPCLFNRDGKTFFERTLFINDQSTMNYQKLDTYISMSAKLSQLKRLNREESDAYGNGEFGLLSFLLVFIIMGGLFAIGMTIGFVALEFVISLGFGEELTFKEIFMATPWKLVFFGCWILFGGSMGILMNHASRK